MQSELVGYIRKNKNNGNLKIHISVEAFDTVERYTSQDGHEYVVLAVRADKIVEILNDEREVTIVCHIKED